MTDPDNLRRLADAATNRAQAKPAEMSEDDLWLDWLEKSRQVELLSQANDTLRKRVKELEEWIVKSNSKPAIAEWDIRGQLRQLCDETEARQQPLGPDFEKAIEDREDLYESDGIAKAMEK